MARHRKDIFSKSEKFFMETEHGWETFWNDNGLDEDPFENDDDKDPISEIYTINFDCPEYKRPKSPEKVIKNVELKKFKDQSTQTVHLFHVSTCTQTDKVVYAGIELQIKNKTKSKKFKTEAKEKVKEIKDANEKKEFEEDSEANGKAKEIKEETNDVNRRIEFEEIGLLKTILDICHKRSKSAEILKPDITKSVYNIPAIKTDFSYYECQTFFMPADTFLYARDSEEFLVNEVDRDDDLQGYTLSVERFTDCLADTSSQKEVEEDSSHAELNLSGIDLKTNSFTEAEQFKVTGLNFDKSCVVINNRIVVDKYSWNTLVSIGLEARRHCTVCSEDTSGLGTSMHLKLESHLRRLMNTPPIGTFGENLIRQVNEATHCAICNRIVPEAMNHINEPLHILRYYWAVEPDSPDKRRVDWKNKSDIKKYATSGDSPPISENEMAAADCVRSTVMEQKETQQPPLIQTDVAFAPATNDVLENHEKRTASVQTHSSVPGSNVEKLGCLQSQIAGETVGGDPKCMVVTARGKDYIVSSNSFHCLLSFKEAWCCMACNRSFPTVLKNVHTSSKEHCEKLSDEAFMYEFGENMIRKLDSKFYHCCVCNRLICCYELTQHIHSKDHKLLTRTMLVRSTSRNIKMQEHTDRNNSACIFNRNAGKITLEIFDAQLRIDRLAWHAVIISGKGVNRCVLCLEDISTFNIDGHLKRPEHEKKLHEISFLAEFGEHLIRQVDEGWRHCAICNKTITIGGEHLRCHIQGWTHMRQLNLAKEINTTTLKQVPPIPAKSEVSDILLDATNNGWPDLSMLLREGRSLSGDVPTTSTLSSELPSSSQVQDRPSTDEPEPFVMIPVSTFSKPNAPEETGVDRALTTRECVVVTFCERTFVITSDAWYCIRTLKPSNTFYCHMCGVRMTKDLVREHTEGSEHRLLMNDTRILDRYSGHLIRQLQTHLNCVTCNAIVPHRFIDEHMEKKKHNNNFLKAQDTAAGMDLIIQSKVEPIKHIKILDSGHSDSILLPLTISIEILASQKPASSGSVESLQGSESFESHSASQSSEQRLKDALCKSGKPLSLDSQSTSQIQVIEKASTSEMNPPASYAADAQGLTSKLKNETVLKLQEPTKKTNETRQEKQVLVSFYDDKFIISDNAWHAVHLQSKYTWRCYLCGTKIRANDLEEHKTSSDHALAVMEADFLVNYEGHLLRELRQGNVNCMTCHTTVASGQVNIGDHVSAKKHKKLLQNAQDIPDDINSDSIRHIRIGVSTDTDKISLLNVYSELQSSRTADVIPECNNESPSANAIPKDSTKDVHPYSDKTMSAQGYPKYCGLTTGAPVARFLQGSKTLESQSASQSSTEKQLKETPSARRMKQISVDRQNTSQIKMIEGSSMSELNPPASYDADVQGLTSKPQNETDFELQELTKKTNDTKEEKQFLVSFNKNKFIISDNAWHAVSLQSKDVCRCYLCDTKMTANDMEEHKTSADHALAIKGASFLVNYEGNLLRQLKLGYVNCMTCHNTVPSGRLNIDGHVSGRKHKQLLEKAKDISGETNSYSMQLDRIWTSMVSDKISLINACSKNPSSRFAEFIPDSDNEAPSAKVPKDLTAAVKGIPQFNDKTPSAQSNPKHSGTPNIEISASQNPVESDNAKGLLDSKIFQSQSLSQSSTGQYSQSTSLIQVINKASASKTNAPISCKADVQGLTSKLDYEMDFELQEKTTKQEKQVLVCFYKNKFMISEDAWHALSLQSKHVCRCYVCDTIMPVRNLEEHKASADHALALKEPGFMVNYAGHLLRILGLGTVNCLTCHTMVPSNQSNISEHLAGKKHKQLLQKAQDIPDGINIGSIEVIVILASIVSDKASPINIDSEKQSSGTAKGIPESNNEVQSAKPIQKGFSEAVKRIPELSYETPSTQDRNTKGTPVAGSKESSAKIKPKYGVVSKEMPESSIGRQSTEIESSGSPQTTVEPRDKVPSAKGKKNKAHVTVTARKEQFLIIFCGKRVLLSSNAWFGIWTLLDGTLRCFLCRVDVDGAGLEEHKRSVPHHIAMMDTRMLEDYTEHFIREVAPKLVNCLVCNKPLLWSELDAHTTEIDHTTNLQACQAYCPEREPSDSTETIKIDMLITGKPTDYCILYNADVSLSVGVSAHAWHGLHKLGKIIACFVCCGKLNESDVEVHKSSEEHRTNLKRFLPSEEYHGEFMRKLEKSLVHCVTCHVIIQPQDVSRHIVNTKHKKNLQEARSKVIQMGTAHIVNYSHFILQNACREN